jgi:hypothetical protein
MASKPSAIVATSSSGTGSPVGLFGEQSQTSFAPDRSTAARISSARWRCDG